MLRTISSVLLCLFATLALGQEKTDPERICGQESGGEVTVHPKGNGAAQIVVKGMSASQGQGRPADGLYCLAKIGPGWAGNADNTVFSFKKALFCAPAKNREAKIDFKWPDYKPGDSGTMGFVPVSVHGDGKIYCWDQKPRPPYPDQNEVTHMKSRITKRVEGIIAVQLLSSGQVIQAMPEEARLLKD